MGRTPDRRPGVLEEDEEIKFIANPTPPSVSGAFNFDGSKFQLNDALGIFDPRGGGVFTVSGGFANTAYTASFGSGSYANNVGADVFFFVSGSPGSIDTATRGVAAFGGDVVVTGSSKFVGGLSGSLTTLADGTSYIIAGDNITVTSASNGAITITGMNGGGGGGSGDPNATYLVLTTTGSLNNERAFVAGTGLNSIDGGANGNYTVSINDSVVATISGSTFTGAVKFNAGLSGSLTSLTDGSSYLVQSGNITITSSSNGSVTISTTAINATEHARLRQLIHFVDEGGPFEGFTAGSYREILPAGDPFPTSVIWWEDSSKVKKLVEETITYNALRLITVDEWKVYDVDGSTVLTTATDTINYVGAFETNRTRTIT